MKIGIIGAGNIGGALAKRFVELGHEVSATTAGHRGRPAGSLCPSRATMRRRNRR